MKIHNLDCLIHNTKKVSNTILNNPTFQTAGSILQAILAKKGLDKKIAQYNFIHSWKEIVGEEIAKRTRPLKIRGQCLLINAVNSVWAQELSFHQEVIVRKLQRYLSPDQKVTSVEFRVGEVEKGGLRNV